MPLAEVSARLQELGINYRAGLVEIINLAEQQQAHEATGQPTVDFRFESSAGMIRSRNRHGCEASLN